MGILIEYSTYCSTNSSNEVLGRCDRDEKNYVNFAAGYNVW